MPTIAQENLIKIMGEIVSNPEAKDLPKTKKEMLLRAGLSESSARKPSRVFGSKGIKELMAKLRIDKESRMERLAEIMWEDDKRSSLGAISELNKMTGDYAPITQRIEDLREKREEIIKPE